MKYTLMVLCTLIFANAIGQDSLAISVKPGSSNKEIRDLLSLMEVEQNQLIVTGKSLKGKRVDIYYEEYDTGKVVSKGSLTGKLPAVLCQATSDTYKIKILSQALVDSTKMNFYFDCFNSSNYFTTYKGTGAYSMRFVQGTANDQPLKFAVDTKRLAVLCYSQPYKKPEEPSYSYYCALTAAGIPPQQWWAQYKVKHYYIFYLDFS